MPSLPVVAAHEGSMQADTALNPRLGRQMTEVVGKPVDPAKSMLEKYYGYEITEGNNKRKSDLIDWPFSVLPIGCFIKFLTCDILTKI